MNKKSSRRITGASLFLILLLLAIGLFSMIRVYNSRNSINEVARIDVPLIEYLTNIETHQLEQSINFERAVRFGEEIGRNKNAIKGFNRADSLFRHLAVLVDEELIQVEEQLKIGITEALTDNQRIIMKDLLNAMKKMEKEHLGYEGNALVVIDLLSRGRLNEALEEVDDVEAEEEKFNKQVEEVLIQLEQYTEEVVSHIELEERTTLRLVVLFTCFFVMMGIIIAFISGNKTAIPIDELTQGVKRINRGEKSVQVNFPPTGLTSELTTTFNEMVINLQDAQEEIERHMQFAYTTAHDLNEPISVLIETLGNLDKNSPEFEKSLERATTSTHQLQTIVKALNEVNKLRESLSAKKEVLSFEHVLSQVEKSMSAQINSSNMIITKWFAKSPTIKYPEAHLKNIFTHLLSNAIKYCSPNRLLEVEIESYNDEQHTVLEVRDNGIGFDSKVNGLEILEPFKQLDPNTEGAGLGLYILKTIIDHHHGRMEVKSKPGKGTIFTIYLN